MPEPKDGLETRLLTFFLDHPGDQPLGELGILGPVTKNCPDVL